MLTGWQLIHECTLPCPFEVGIGSKPSSDNYWIQPKNVEHHLWMQNKWNLKEDFLSAKNWKATLQFTQAHQNWTVDVTIHLPICHICITPTCNQIQLHSLHLNQKKYLNPSFAHTLCLISSVIMWTVFLLSALHVPEPACLAAALVIIMFSV